MGFHGDDGDPRDIIRLDSLEQLDEGYTGCRCIELWAGINDQGVDAWAVGMHKPKLYPRYRYAFFAVSQLPEFLDGLDKMQHTLGAPLELDDPILTMRSGLRHDLEFSWHSFGGALRAYIRRAHVPWKYALTLRPEEVALVAEWLRDVADDEGIGTRLPTGNSVPPPARGNVRSFLTPPATGRRKPYPAAVKTKPTNAMLEN